MIEALAKVSEVATEAAESSSGAEIDPDARIETESTSSETVPESEIDPDARVEDATSDSERQGDVSEERKTGGTYGELKKEWSGELETPPPHEVHHMPANDVNGLMLVALVGDPNE